MGQKLLGGVVIAGGVGGIGLVTYRAINEDWAKYSSNQRVGRAVSMIAGVSYGAGLALLGSDLLLKNDLAKSGFVVSGASLALGGLGEVITHPKDTRSYVILGGGLFFGGAFIMMTMRNAPSSKVASVLSHVAVANNGLAISGQF